MTQKYFETQLLVSCYLYSSERGTPTVDISEVVDRFDLQAEPGWIATSKASLVKNGLALHAVDLRAERSDEIQLTSRGKDLAERWLDESVVRFEPE